MYKGDTVEYKKHGSLLMGTVIDMETKPRLNKYRMYTLNDIHGEFGIKPTDEERIFECDILKILRSKKLNSLMKKLKNV